MNRFLQINLCVCVSIDIYRYTELEIHTLSLLVVSLETPDPYRVGVEAILWESYVHFLCSLFLYS